mmetsp:Transcript_16811/g.37807  ORF Transcript_16811/g.37807 Transcript_16811/m.37807 type:complete len:95 (+) Transcript_16811:775-1059(+)
MESISEDAVATSKLLPPNSIIERLDNGIVVLVTRGENVGVDLWLYRGEYQIARRCRWCDGPVKAATADRWKRKKTEARFVIMEEPRHPRILRRS